MTTAPARRAAVLLAAVTITTLSVRAADPPPVWTGKDLQNGTIPQTYTVRQGHPRLLITPDNKPDILDKIKAAPNVWRKVIATAEAEAPPKGARRVGGPAEDVAIACGAVYQLGLVDGFKYAHTREEYGRRGVAALMTIDGKEALGLKFGIALGYDWLFDLLTADQKKTLAKRMAEAAPKVIGTAGNAMKGLGIIHGLAFYGDGVDDAAAKAVTDRLFKEVWWGEGTPKQTWFVHVRYLEGGGDNEGISYWARHVPTFPVVAAWQTATGQNYFERLGYFRNLPYWMAHTISPRPTDMRGDYYALPVYNYAGRGLWPPSYDQMMAAATGYLKAVDPAAASLARWWVDHGRSTRGNGAGYEDIPDGLVYGVLIGDPRVKGAPPGKLGTPKTFVMAGLNNVYLRSDWDDPDATCVFLGNTRARMRACASNEFMLWKNGGPLFLYRGGLHHHNYWHGGGWALNGVIFYDGRDQISPFHVSGNTADVGGTLLTASEPGQYDFARGDCARAYRVEGPEKLGGGITRAERTVVYLRPTGADKTDHVVILDRTESKSPKARPHVVFNTVFEPKVAAEFDAPDQGKAVLPGQWRYDRAGCVTVTNEYDYTAEAPHTKAHARAFLKTLYPPNVQVIKSGGKDHPLDDLEGKREGNHPLDNVNVLNGGFWRFHVVPATDDTRHSVLHAIEATDSKVTKAGALELLDGPDILGAVAGSNVVLFSKAGGPLTAGAVTVGRAGTYRVVVADLPAGAAVTLTAGATAHKLTATPAGTALAANVKLAAGDTLRIGK